MYVTFLAVGVAHSTQCRELYIGLDMIFLYNHHLSFLSPGNKGTPNILGWCGPPLSVLRAGYLW